MKLTPTQLEVLRGIHCDNNPWVGVKQRGDARRTKVILKLLDLGLITASYNLSLAWVTREGVRACNYK